MNFVESIMNPQQQIEAFANEHMDKWGLTQKGWTFGWHKKRTSLGSCNWTRKRILLSSFLFAHLTQEERQDTILHEIAHAMDFETRGMSDHGPKWKSWAIRVGAKPERCKSISDASDADVAKRSKYTLRCPNGHEFPRHRWSAGRVASCPTCNPHAFDERCKLVPIRNY